MARDRSENQWRIDDDQIKVGFLILNKVPGCLLGIDLSVVSMVKLSHQLPNPMYPPCLHDMLDEDLMPVLAL
jgi:hypothetical protein